MTGALALIVFESSWSNVLQLPNWKFKLNCHERSAVYKLLWLYSLTHPNINKHQFPLCCLHLMFSQGSQLKIIEALLS